MTDDEGFRRHLRHLRRERDSEIQRTQREQYNRSRSAVQAAQMVEAQYRVSLDRCRPYADKLHQACSEAVEMLQARGAAPDIYLKLLESRRRFGVQRIRLWSLTKSEHTDFSNAHGQATSSISGIGLWVDGNLYEYSAAVEGKHYGSLSALDVLSMMTNKDAAAYGDTAPSYGALQQFKVYYDLLSQMLLDRNVV